MISLKMADNVLWYLQSTLSVNTYAFMKAMFFKKATFETLDHKFNSS